MNARIRYALGICLQVVGLLNFVFLVGVPIWLAGRRLCRDARTIDRSLPVAERRPGDDGSTEIEPRTHDPQLSDRSKSARPSESRSERRELVGRN